MKQAFKHDLDIELKEQHTLNEITLIKHNDTLTPEENLDMYRSILMTFCNETFNFNEAEQKIVDHNDLPLTSRCIRYIDAIEADLSCFYNPSHMTKSVTVYLSIIVLMLFIIITSINNEVSYGSALELSFAFLAVIIGSQLFSQVFLFDWTDKAVRRKPSRLLKTIHSLLSTTLLFNVFCYSETLLLIKNALLNKATKNFNHPLIPIIANANYQFTQLGFTPPLNENEYYLICYKEANQVKEKYYYKTLSEIALPHLENKNLSRHLSLASDIKKLLSQGVSRANIKHILADKYSDLLIQKDTHTQSQYVELNELLDLLTQCYDINDLQIEQIRNNLEEINQNSNNNGGLNQVNEEYILLLKTTITELHNLQKNNPNILKPKWHNDEQYNWSDLNQLYLILQQDVIEYGKYILNDSDAN